MSSADHSQSRHAGHANTPAADAVLVSIAVPNDRDLINQAQERVLEALARNGYPDASRFAVRLALEEAMANAFRHGHRQLSDEVPLQLDCQIGPAEVVLSIADKGPGFNPGAVPDPRLEENIERPTGRGLFLMRAYMASIAFNDRGNKVTMTYRRA